MKKGNIRQCVEIVGKGESCPKCKEVMQRRKHKYLTEKQQNSPYYFSEWDVCTNYKCRMIKHYDKFKVYNNNNIGIYSKSKEEENNLLNLMRNF